MAGEAPFITGNDLLAYQGNPNLAVGSGAVGTPNVINTQPLENSIEQAQNRVAAAKQQQQQFRNSLYLRSLEDDHADKVMQYKQNIEDRDNLYKMLSTGNQSVFNMQDGGGNDRSITPLPSDREIFTKGAEDIRKELMDGNYTQKMSDPAFRSKLDTQQKLVALAGVRAAQVTKLKQQLSQTQNPDEQKNIQNSIDSIVNTPLTDGQMPDGHLPLPEVKPLLGDVNKEYPSGKGLEHYMINGIPYIGRPFSDMEGRLYAYPSNQVWINANSYKKQPEYNNADAFQKYNQRVQPLWTAMGGKEPLNIGAIDANGTVIPNTDPRPIAVAEELLSGNHLMKDPNAEKDKADLDYKKKQTAKLESDMAGGATKLTAEEIKENRDKDYVKSVKEDVDKIFIPSGSIKPESFKDKVKNIFGIKDSENMYPISKNIADKYIGIEAPEESITTKNDKGISQTLKSLSGQSLKPDEVYLSINKKNGEKQLVFAKGGNIIARVDRKQAIVNGIKHDAKYEPSNYENKIAHVDEVYEDVTPPKPNQQTTSKAHPGYEKRITKKGTVYYVDQSGKEYWDSGDGELIPL